MDRFDQALMRLARFVAPRHRRNWVDAMDHEIPHIPTAEHRSFIAGCLLNSLKQRIKDMRSVPPLRIVPGLLGSAFLAVLCLANGARLLADAPVIGTILLALSALWISIFGAVQAQSSHTLAKFAVLGLAFYSAIGAASLTGAPAFTSDGAFYRALALEGLLLFSAVLIISQIPFFWAKAKPTT